MAFVRRKGNTYYLVHNVRRQRKGAADCTWRGWGSGRESPTMWCERFRATTLP